MKYKCPLFIGLLAMASQARAEEPDMANFAKSVRNIHELTFATPAYQQTALRLIVADANRAAQDLHLPEILPITESNLVSCYIPPPRMAQRLGAIGNITTANYTYYFSMENKFSFLTKTGLQQDYSKLQKEYLWPIGRMDTNAAYQLATQFLSQASMDVPALNKDCHVHILPFTPEGDNGKHFVPVYWIYWSKPEQEGRGSTASVELLAPTKTIRQLRVEEAKYVLRPSLQITNLEELLAQTNALPVGNLK